MTIKDIHDWLDFMTDKAQGTYYTYAEKDVALDRAQMQYFNEQYAQYALAEKMQDSLSPFKTTYSFLTSDTSGGVLNLPSDYMYLVGGEVTVVDGDHTRYRSLKILPEDQIPYRRDSQLRAVSSSKPVAAIKGKVSGITIIQLYPKTAMAGEVYYLRRPLAPVFGYTVSGRTINYDPTLSNQMEWGESELNEIMTRALSFLSSSVDDVFMTQYSEAKSKQIN